MPRTKPTSFCLSFSDRVSGTQGWPQICYELGLVILLALPPSAGIIGVRHCAQLAYLCLLGHIRAQYNFPRERQPRKREDDLENG